MKVRNLNNNYYATEEIIPLNETSLYRAVKEHDKNGYIIISAFRQDCLSDKKENPSAQEIFDENNRRTNNLKKDITNLSYSFIPVYGGYKEEGAEKASVEKSFIVFPYDFRTKENVDFEEFEKNLINLCEKYNQDAILIKRPDTKPRYYFPSTNSWDDVEFGSLKLNDVAQKYFTSLKSWQDISLNKKNRTTWNGTPKRFSYSETFLRLPPQSIMAAHARESEGELFSMEHFKNK